MSAMALSNPSPAAVKGNRPNVVFILTDDQRSDTIAALGNPRIQTPNLDRLVKTGFVFNRAYCMGSQISAVCMPSRTQILTGMSQFRAKDAPSGTDPGRYTFPRAMKEAGYTTMRTGKFGNHPTMICAEFDRYIQIRRHTTCTEEHTNNGIEFIRENAGKRAFFLLLAYAAPHDPQPAPQEYRDLYRAGDMALSPNFLPFHPFDIGEPPGRDELTLGWPRTRENVSGKMARYYASITYADAQIGRILDVLGETGQAGNTFLVFASDNGLSLGDHGLLGKQNLYESGGMHVPLLFAGPGIPAGSTDALVYLFDVYPTVCDLAGISVPRRIDGRSLSPVIHGRGKSVRDTVFCAYKDVQRSLRDDRWKLYRYPKINKTQLFDLRNDPHEIKDLADDPEHAGRIKKMTSLLAEAQEQFDDTAPLSSESPARAEADLDYYLKFNPRVDPDSQ